ncbi:MAG: flagellar export chaperone FliS [Candidatus Sericytochromatia bacterium]
MYRLYEYMNWRLIQANIKRDQAMVLEVQARLRELREAWVEAIKLQGVQASASGAA